MCLHPEFEYSSLILHKRCLRSLWRIWFSYWLLRLLILKTIPIGVNTNDWTSIFTLCQCVLYIRSYFSCPVGYTEDKLAFKWMNNTSNSPVIVNKMVELPQFEVNGQEPNYCYKMYHQHTGEFSHKLWFHLSLIFVFKSHEQEDIFDVHGELFWNILVHYLTGWLLTGFFLGWLIGWLVSWLTGCLFRWVVG